MSKVGCVIFPNADATQPFASVTITVYKPVSAELILFIHGPEIIELKLFGPVQLYVEPPVAVKQI